MGGRMCKREGECVRGREVRREGERDKECQRGDTHTHVRTNVRTSKHAKVQIDEDTGDRDC